MKRKNGAVGIDEPDSKKVKVEDDSKVKEAIKRVKKEGLKASASIVKKEKMRYCLVLIQVFVL